MRTKKQIRSIISDPHGFEKRLENDYTPFFQSDQDVFEQDKSLIRRLIDELDDEIVECLQLRQRIVDVLHILKEKNDEDIKDIPREDEIKMRLVSEYPEMEETILTLYNHIFD